MTYKDAVMKQLQSIISLIESSSRVESCEYKVGVHKDEVVREFDSFPFIDPNSYEGRLTFQVKVVCDYEVNR